MEYSYVRDREITDRHRVLVGDVCRSSVDQHQKCHHLLRASIALRHFVVTSDNELTLTGIAGDRAISGEVYCIYLFNHCTAQR